MPKLILIDGNAIFYRAFHSLPLFKTSKGECTNAVYGFLRMLLDLLNRERPEYIAVAFDSAQKTFRHEAYKEYKATRSAPPPDLYPQLPRLKEGLAILNVPIFELGGYEADDILGTIAAHAEKDPNLKTIIVTGDRDAFQLVTSKTHIMVPLKGMSEVLDYTPEKVEEKTGLRPHQIVDYKALKGDASDNIKGINGIGDKQAVALLQKYGTLENIYEHLIALSKTQQQKFIIGREQSFQSKRLATIIRDVPIQFNLELCKFKKAPYYKLKEFFENLEFKGMVKKLMEIPAIIAFDPDQFKPESLQQSLF